MGMILLFYLSLTHICLTRVLTFVFCVHIVAITCHGLDVIVRMCFSRAILAQYLIFAKPNYYFQ